MFTNLLPYVIYIIRAKCCTLAGWSDFCRPIKPLTVAYVPDIPDPLQICKVTTNGVLLQWHPPFRTNGRKVDHYQIEIIDARSAGSVDEVPEVEAKETTQPSTSVDNGGSGRNNSIQDDNDGATRKVEMSSSTISDTHLQESKNSIIVKNRKLKRLKLQSSQGTCSTDKRRVLIDIQYSLNYSTNIYRYTKNRHHTSL